MPEFMTSNEEIILLAVLKLQGNAYGMSIRRQIFKDMGDKRSFASICQPKDNLVRKKYVRNKKGDPTAKRGGKSGFYYEIALEGLRNLRKLKKEHEQAWAGIPEISVEDGR